MRQPLHILMVEDCEKDRELVVKELERGGYQIMSERVETAAGFKKALGTGGWDLVIADYNLPAFSAPDALRLLQESKVDLPFVIVSGAIGEEEAVTAMKSGAHDYILKSSLARLVPVVQRELREARARQERRRAVSSVAALSKLGQSLAATSTPLDAAHVISEAAEELFTWDDFMLDLYFEADDKILSVLHVGTIAGRKQDLPVTAADEIPDAVARRIINSGSELILQTDVATAGDHGRAPASLMYVPVHNQTRVIGIISIQSHRAKAYDHQSLRTLQTLADYCGGALERMRAREELRESREQLRALAAHLQSIREEERKLITREIHDELGQSLTGFKMDLAWIRNRMQSEDWGTIRQPILDKMVTMGKLLDGTATLMRRICTELRPGVLDDLGLTAAIEWQAREYQERTGIVCDLRIDLGDLNVDPERSTALFRIFQEILTNVARHARATRVEAVLEKVNGNFLLTVKDNGRGIKKSEIAGAKSLGLLGMRERAVILGGEVEINGTAGKGTTVCVKMPLPELNVGPVEAEASVEASDAAENHQTKRRAIN